MIDDVMISAINKTLISNLGLEKCREVQVQLSVKELIAHALNTGEGVLTNTGALMCDTGKFTGRSPKDKFIVRDAKTADTVAWGDVNQPFEPAQFAQLHAKMLAFLADKEVYLRLARAGASQKYGLNVAIVTTQAWQSLFVNNLFIRPNEQELTDFAPDWTVYCLPEFEADPLVDGTRQKNFTLVDFTKRLILIGGSGYAGEIKKGIFTVLNFLLPIEHNALPMHCSANVGTEGDTALFFGLSGTGKTTLSADPNRRLIGDDEHGWADDEIANFEGGCYAKVIDLSAEKEPKIFAAIKPGAILENTRFHELSNLVNYADKSVTENTRTAYPLDFIEGAIQPSVAQFPKNIFFLTADAFGVLPPISKLTSEQAITYFLAGYTSKLAGTEMGITQPVATFSACFGAAFLPLPPQQYAKLLQQKIEKYDVKVWLINTGWTGGGYGTGSRMKLPYTRAMIQAALAGNLEKVDYQTHEIFGLQMPTSCPNVPSELLNPAQTWSDPTAYQQKAQQLATKFAENHTQQHNNTKTQ